MTKSFFFFLLLTGRVKANLKTKQKSCPRILLEIHMHLLVQGKCWICWWRQLTSLSSEFTEPADSFFLNAAS